MNIASPLFSGADQIGLVVRKLEPWLERYAAMGIGPWWVGTYAAPNLTETKVRGRDVAYSMRLALAWVGKMQWELIEPLEGPSIYKEHLAEHGEGFHHIQLPYDGLTFDAFAHDMELRGLTRLMEGVYGRSRFVYFDTVKTMGLITEVRNAPMNYVRPDPDFWYPAGESASFGR
jgi:methylmalonyl-CoA/ethylmalonyl-CoA epimerase